MKFTKKLSDLDTVRGVAALHCQSLFSAQALARNIDVKPHQLDDFLRGKAELPPRAMLDAVRILFHGKAQWGPDAQALVDVVKPVTAQMGAADMPKTAINLPSHACTLTPALRPPSSSPGWAG